MTLKSYLWGMRFLTLVFLIALIFVLNYLDPSQASSKIIFYAVLFSFLSSWFNLIFLFIRRQTIGEEQTSANLRLNMRQSILLAFLVVGIFLFQSFRMLIWWDGLLLVAGIFLIELYFLSRN